MTLTRANAESILIKRSGKKMTFAGLDGTTVGGTNADLNDPIGNALLGMGITPASIVAITDADLSGVASDNYEEFLDRAQYRLLKNIAGNLDLVDIQVGPRRESLSQIHEQVQKEIETLELSLAKQYGVGLGTLSTGTIELDFQESL